MFGDLLETADYNKQQFLEKNPFPTKQQIQERNESSDYYGSPYSNKSSKGKASLVNKYHPAGN